MKMIGATAEMARTRVDIGNPDVLVGIIDTGNGLDASDLDVDTFNAELKL